MSLFGAMNTAISGLNAQSDAFSNISDNVANAQTVGYKRVDTNFVDYLTTSTSSVNAPGSVAARPDYVNNVQGTVTQTDNPLGLAIAGQGFFAVSQTTGENNNIPTFSSQQFYTRAGDFQMDKNGYLVNSANEALNGWLINPATGTINQNTLVPIQVTQAVFNPQPTGNVTISANLPATPLNGTATLANPISSDIDVYDALGTLHTVTLNWVKDPVNPDSWTVRIDVPDDVTGGVPAPDRGTADISFGPTASGNPVPPGTVGNILINALDPGTIVSAGYTAAAAATLSFTTDFGSGAQTITLNVGTYGQTNGVTQYAGTQYSLRGLTQDGVPPGSFSSVTTQTNGNIVLNYDNGQTRTIAQVPLITFNNPNQLQRQDGQAFTATLQSGTPLAEQTGTNGAGNLVVQSIENSNVDIATEFSKLIVAQRAYSASAKMVTTADDMLQQTIDMKR
jgi:flagellar hook protein FlgE